MTIAAAAPRAVIFDLDGTLVDSARDIADALDELLERHGRRRIGLDAARRLIGHGAPSLVSRAFALTGGAPADVDRLTAEYLSIYEGELARATRPYPGVVATLQRLAAAGLGLAVCTNKATAATQRLLEALDLAAFFPVVIGGDSGARKPDPEPVRRALAGLGVAAGAALMVGDSANDVAAARGAGVAVVVVGYGYTETPPAELGADAVLARFDELAARILSPAPSRARDR
ncbi:MAG: phosphoglycolate phosphatase [Alphaproteobacteria bacterium]|nr:phosphoglycolate phosphatase [Alphaproteobacteria bacterium]